MSKFWDHYEAAKPKIAAAVDDVRHKVIEEGWFGKQTTGPIAAEPVHPLGPAMPETDKDATGGTPHNHATLYSEIWGKETTHADVYGKAPSSSQAPEITPGSSHQEGRGLEPDL